MFRPMSALAAASACFLILGMMASAQEPAKTVTAKEVRASELETALAAHKGKVVVLDCWATWCGPCVKKFPHLVELNKKYAEKGLVCVSLSLDKIDDLESYKMDKVLTFLKEHNAKFPNFILKEPKQDEAALSKLLGPEYDVIPYLVIFDRAGKRAWNTSVDKKVTTEQLDKVIEEQLAAKP